MADYDAHERAPALHYGRDIIIMYRRIRETAFGCQEGRRVVDIEANVTGEDYTSIFAPREQWELSRLFLTCGNRDPS